MPGMLRVLYVEDDPVNALVVEELLASRTGLQLTVVEDGAAAMQVAIAAPPDLLLLDHQLPDTSGPALLERLRQAGVHAPAWLLSAHRLAAPPPGFAACFGKPLDFAAFLQAVEHFRLAADRGP